MTDYCWSVDKIDMLPFFGGQSNVVCGASWHVTATSGLLKTDFYGHTDVGIEDLTDFIPYSELTNDIIVEWIKAAVDETWIKSCLDLQLKQLQSANIITQIR